MDEDEARHLPAEGTLWAVEAALQVARLSGDREQLMALYRQGAEAARRDPTLADVQAYMACSLGDLHVAEGDYRAAAEAYSNFGPRPLPFSLLIRLGLALLAFDPVRSVRVLSIALRTLPTDTPTDWRTPLEAGLTWALALNGSLYEAVRLARNALSRLGNSASAGMARTLIRGTLGMALFYHGEAEEARPHLESARAGWSARGTEQGVALMNGVLIGIPSEQATLMWLPLVFGALPDASEELPYPNARRSG